MNILLMQLPIPQMNFGRQTGNIPLGAACLAEAAKSVPGARVEILAESLVSYLADAAILDIVLEKKPDMLGFTVFSWNVERSLYLAREAKRLLGATILFGGPEVTPDNSLIDRSIVDHAVCGEGEAVFLALLREEAGLKREDGARQVPLPSAETIFRSSPSPYMADLLEPHIENMLLLETQRGCPYRCGYCYYSKSRDRVCVAGDEIVFEGIRWAMEQGLPEVFLLDPSLDARPKLGAFADRIAGINADGRLSFLSEIRAEAIDSVLAKKLARAGFVEFEIGLQSTNPAALKAMNRPTNLSRFRRGVECLKAVGIRPKIDLIIGLPGDDPAGFRASVDFIAENKMHDDVQVFFLSVLPGTDFRKNAKNLGLVYDPLPPYTILETPAFSPDEMLAAFAYAEETFGITLQPDPDLDLSCRRDSALTGLPAGSADQAAGDMEKGPAKSNAIENSSESCGTGAKDPETCGYVTKVVLDSPRPVKWLEGVARRLSHPYQVIFRPQLSDEEFMCRALGVFTRENPHTPLEVVFMEPENPPDIEVFEEALNLDRPLYLDRDLPALGSRTVLYTLVSGDPELRFEGIMKRQVFWWRKERLPAVAEIEALYGLDGILVDARAPLDQITGWQDLAGGIEEETLAVTFSDPGLQQRWMRLTAPGEYYLLPER